MTDRTNGTASTTHVVVTGVSQGLGEALALELLGRGMRVLGVGRSSSPRLVDERAGPSQARIPPRGGQRSAEGARVGGPPYTGYRFLRCDLAQATMLPAVLEPAFEAIASERPSYVCLVNNAATLDPVGVLGTTEADHIVTSLTVNLAAPVVLASEFCRVFRDDAIERRIVNVSSGAAQSVIAGESLYCVAKAGLEMLTRTLAAEHDSPRFRAINLRPGIMDTQMQTYARTRSRERLPSVDLFKGFHAENQLVPPDVVARKVVDRLVLADVEQGRTYSYREL